VAPPTIRYRRLEREDLARLGEIDRSERITSIFVQRGEVLEERSVDHRVPPWFEEGDGEYSLAYERHFCERHLDAGAEGIVVFDGDRLVGLGLVTPSVGPAIAQLAFLYVSNGHRGLGIGSTLTRELERTARESGAEEIVVSAVPSGATVRFYLAQGYAPTAHPLPELFELEPEDVHMSKTLRA
jgi:ribosomal protein S18 acetylase RimI-like enzyme